MVWAKLRSKLDSVSTLATLASLLVFMTVSVVLTVIVSGDPDWGRWHFSYLGEGSGLSARIFNLSIMISSVFIFVAAYTVRKELYLIKHSDARFHGVRPNFFAAIIVIMGLSLIFVALTPRDIYPALHDLFGHDTYYCVIIMSLLSPLFLPGYPLQFYVYSYAQHLLYLLFEYLYRINILSNLYPMQIAIFLVSCVWIVAMTWPARKIQMQTPTASEHGLRPI